MATKSIKTRLILERRRYATGDKHFKHHSYQLPDWNWLPINRWQIKAKLFRSGERESEIVFEDEDSTYKIANTSSNNKWNQDLVEKMASNYRWHKMPCVFHFTSSFHNMKDQMDRFTIDHTTWTWTFEKENIKVCINERWLMYETRRQEKTASSATIQLRPRLQMHNKEMRWMAEANQLLYNITSTHTHKKLPRQVAHQVFLYFCWNGRRLVY